eukprot:EG_transcript_17380
MGLTRSAEDRNPSRSQLRPALKHSITQCVGSSEDWKGRLGAESCAGARGKSQVDVSQLDTSLLCTVPSRTPAWRRVFCDNCGWVLGQVGFTAKCGHSAQGRLCVGRGDNRAGFCGKWRSGFDKHIGRKLQSILKQAQGGPEAINHSTCGR